VREVASRVDKHDVGGRCLNERGRVGGQYPHGVKQQAKGWKDLSGRLKYAGHQQQLTHLVPPPDDRRWLAPSLPV
jgi:hypothetical protein